MPRHLLRSFLTPAISTALLLLTSTILFAQAQGPQHVPIPPVLAKPIPGKHKTDRNLLPPVPVFRDVAKQLGVTATHIAAPEARYVLDSISGGTGLFDCDDDGRLDIVLVNGSTVDRLRAGGDPMVTLYHLEPDGTSTDIFGVAGHLPNP